jgi:hypothetical protein
MATAKTRAQLRRLSDLSLIRSALPGRAQRGDDQNVGLQEIGTLCRQRARSLTGRDCHAVRDLLLTIASEWDLGCERLEEQSDVCLAAIAEMLGPPR